MARRPALALARPQPIRPAFAHPSRRVAVAALALAALLALAYVAARGTSLFALRSLEVSGAPPDVADEVEAAAGEALGESLVALDAGALGRRLRSLPTVVSVELDRSFPHGLRVSVQAERPAVLVRAGTRAWLVSRRARVIREVPAEAAGELPRVWLPSSVDLVPGAFVARDLQAEAIRALARVPATFPVEIVRGRETDRQIVLVLAGERELRLGSTSEIAVKLAAAAIVLRSLRPDQREALLYVDVSLPERVVVG